jgi:hypothetical protein
MGQSAVAQGEPPRGRNAFVGLLAAYDLGGKQEMLDLFLGKSSVIRTGHA